jgi:hypothetical protein
MSSIPGMFGFHPGFLVSDAVGFSALLGESKLEVNAEAPVPVAVVGFVVLTEAGTLAAVRVLCRGVLIICWFNRGRIPIQVAWNLFTKNIEPKTQIKYNDDLWRKKLAPIERIGRPKNKITRFEQPLGHNTTTNILRRIHVQTKTHAQSNSHAYLSSPPISSFSW